MYGVEGQENTFGINFSPITTERRNQGWKKGEWDGDAAPAPVLGRCFWNSMLLQNRRTLLLIYLLKGDVNLPKLHEFNKVVLNWLNTTPILF